jgi:hypothetical protein
MTITTVLHSRTAPSLFSFFQFLKRTLHPRDFNHLRSGLGRSPLINLSNSIQYLLAYCVMKRICIDRLAPIVMTSFVCNRTAAFGIEVL